MPLRVCVRARVCGFVRVREKERRETEEMSGEGVGGRGGQWMETVRRAPRRAIEVEVGSGGEEGGVKKIMYYY